MKRELTALLLLILLIACSVWNLARLDRLTDRISLCLDRAEAAAGDGDPEAALKALDDGLVLWRRARDYTNVFLRHPDVDAVSDAFCDLQEALLERGSETYPAAFARLRDRLARIDYKEHPSLGTIF